MAIRTQASPRKRAADLETAIDRWIRASRRTLSAPPTGREGVAEEAAWAEVIEALGRAPLTRTGTPAS